MGALGALGALVVLAEVGKIAEEGKLAVEVEVAGLLKSSTGIRGQLGSYGRKKYVAGGFDPCAALGSE